MRRVLFVDDEPKLLDGLRRMLHPLRHEWQMSFAGGSLEALQILECEPCDVLVTDIQMPGMTGIELLAEVVKRHPQVIRVVLSGTADPTLTLRSVMLAHQFLIKPCDPEILKSTLGRVVSLRETLRNPALKQLIARIHTLPSLPSAYLRLMDALRSAEVSATEIGAIISQDIAMTAKVLQLVNSSFFGIHRQIADPREAVLCLGLDTVRALALSVAAFSEFDSRCESRFSLEELRTHALAVATLARQMGKSLNLGKAATDEAFSAGLLHDIGRLVLASNCPLEYDAVLQQVALGGSSIREAEQEMFGTTHAEVGAYLLWLWGLPGTVVEAVAVHHHPTALSDPSPIAMLVHLGDALCADGDEGHLDHAAVDAIGWRDDLPQWNTMAQTMLAGEART